MEFSVVIPTSNRFEKLRNVLKSLQGQTLDPDSFEVIIVDDGSQDPSYRKLSRLSSLYPPLQIKTFRQPPKGAAAARNLAISHARGEYVLFLGDDTTADPNLLKEHSQLLQRRANGSVLGFVKWEKSLAVNPLMHYIAPYGPQFDFRIKNPRDCGYRRFYTSNLSVAREFLTEEPFNCCFPGCNWEDIELGYRLEKKGMRIVYNPAAVVYHDHSYDEESFLRRQQAAGRNKKIFYDLHPELKGLFSRPFALMLRLALGKFVKFLGTLLHIRRLYYRGLFEEAWIKEFLKT